MRHDLSVASFYTASLSGGAEAGGGGSFGAASASGWDVSSAGGGAPAADPDEAQHAHMASIEGWERDAARVVCAQRALAALLEMSVPQPGAFVASQAPSEQQQRFGGSPRDPAPLASSRGAGGMDGPQSGSSVVDQSLLDLLLAILRGGAWQLVSGAFLEAVLFHLQV